MKLNKVVKLIYKTLPKEFEITPENKFVKRSKGISDRDNDNGILELTIVIHDENKISIHYYEGGGDETFHLDSVEGGDVIRYKELTKEELKNKLVSMFEFTFKKPLNKLK
jgi:hypothetical protein